MGILTRYIPNEMSAPIHGLIRKSHRFLYDWGCCSRSECPLEEMGAQQPAPRNCDTPVVPVRTTWNRIGGPPRVKRFRREPLTHFAVGAAVLIGATSGAASWALTSFAKSTSQQSKINDEITKLGTLVGQLNKMDQTQWRGQNKINMELLKDREEFSHRIETALCSASETQTQNELSLELSNLRLQYRTSLSAVVTAITTRRITPEILPVSSLRNS